MSSFKSIGNNVVISPKASIYGAERIEIGDNVRIDDFCILSAGEGGIVIGSNVHIACYSSLIGGGKITLADYVGIGARTSIYSSSDDFSGNFLIGPTIEKKYTNVKHEPVTLRKYSLIGCGCVVLPGSILEEGAAVGAMSLVKGTVKSYTINAGNPLRFIKQRETRMTRFTSSGNHAEPWIDAGFTLPQSTYLEGIDWHIDK